MDFSGIERLDTATRSKIRSTQILTSLPQIISELVQNSLDAGAKSIDVGVHCADWMCWVGDDGTGISKDGLSLIAQGMEGGRYSSSKSYNLTSLEHVNTFGFRGEALASAADLSCIEISSRTSRSKECWSVILKGGEKLYEGPSLRWRRERAGTTVSIRDVFFSLPIRRLSHPSPSRTIELVRRELETFALVFPHVSFTLKDASKEYCGTIDKSRVLTIPKTSSSMATFRHLFGRALVEHVDTIYVQSGSMKLEGFISLVGSPSKSYQFLYVNRHILDSCELHRIIDKCFSSSTFGKHAYDESGELPSLRPGTRRSPRKSELRPVYVLNLTLPARNVDNCLEPSKTAVQFQDQNAVRSFLEQTIQSFLCKHGFKATRSSDSRATHVNTANKRKRVDPVDASGTKLLERPESTASSSLQRLQLEERREDMFIQGPSLQDGDCELKWVDPCTGKTFLIDQRTGNSYMQDHHEERDESEASLRTNRRTLVDTRWLKNAQGECQHACESEENMPDWIKEALQSNDNIAATERSIPRISSLKNVVDQSDVAQRIPWLKQFDQTFSTTSGILAELGEASMFPFSRECLEKLEVLGQVDFKFIACLIDEESHAPSSSDAEGIPGTSERGSDVRMLVLVDQHAADERVRVERYLKSLCLGYLDRDREGVERRALDPPVPTLLTKFERDRLLDSERIKRAFSAWGLDFVDAPTGDRMCEENDNDEGYGLVHCNSVPEVVADKLLDGSQGDLRELVKGYLARLEAEGMDESQGPSQAAADTDEFSWLKALRHCPRELTELVNSRACRGAIMFNDRLSVEQCKRLLRQLSETAFPFQCAHGRPSVVALTTIRDDRDTGRLKRSHRTIDWTNLA
ncbi:uncharacterized protein FOMMEDRAFT_148054 [Fomitiporia mediterranea MF3/22]|uniref:uncharacterized protein n=1 Tax=Fomitiporia mediterranea (strain MF3/22) TaxID=694068 RepID=UPI00044082C2|nr:uncharacterized protein FOMMEDRAFT_148054 [Fomitiporia mediterranea MF3/22]EJD01597.1 hypothetical protein FOMMEDRAFT_148054 [Fomitiporia mediterranea MF3/22]